VAKMALLRSMGGKIMEKDEKLNKNNALINNRIR
jgi:hypothetical protein